MTGTNAARSAHGAADRQGARRPAAAEGADRGGADSHSSHPHDTRDDVLLRRWGEPRFHGWLSRRPTRFLDKVKQFLWGLLFFEWYHELRHVRSRYNDVMNLILFGEMLGIPLMNSSIGLRLLPYALPDLHAWKHRQLEELVVEEHAPHIH